MTSPTATTGAGTFSTRWVELPSGEMHRLAFEYLHAKGLCYLQQLLDFMREVEAESRDRTILESTRAA